MRTKGRIDMHQHIVPDDYAGWLGEQGVTAGGLPIPKWNVEGALDAMEANNVDVAILSLSTPGVHLGDDAQARVQARKVNEFTARVVADHPDRFGFFATLTLPDLDGALVELDYVYDVLHADGVVLHTSVRGRYLGDPSWDPLMAELNRRKAVIFAHPGELLGPEAPGLRAHVADFLLDTVRAAICLAKSGCMEKYPDLSVILSHGGGFVPFAAERIARTCSPDGSNKLGIQRLQRFYYDTALASSPYSLPSLLAFADPERIIFGSDWPHAPQARGAHFTSLLDEFPLAETLRTAIDRTNAEQLFPRFV